MVKMIVNGENLQSLGFYIHLNVFYPLVIQKEQGIFFDRHLYHDGVGRARF